MRGGRGHLFQGRYQAILVEPGPALARVVDYIHLNPVRAGIVVAQEAASFRWSSLGRYMRGARPPGAACEDWLRERGCTDTASGWVDYQAHSVRAMSKPLERENDDYGPLSGGWAIGSRAWRQAVAQDHAPRKLEGGSHDGPEARALREVQWAQAAERLLGKIGKTHLNAKEDRKGADWKVAVAEALRRKTSAANGRIADYLHMGTGGSVSKYLSLVGAGKLEIHKIED